MYIVKQGTSIVSFFIQGGKNLEQHTKAPLWEALLAHQQKVQGNFHVPGHKQGKIFDPSAIGYFSILALDLTEVGDLDDLHHPFGVIQEAQILAAKAFGSDRCFFLVGGTTVGNLAAIYTVTTGGKKLIVQRNCHQSVFHGMMLAQAEGVAIATSLNEETGNEDMLNPEELYQLLADTSDVGAVMVTSPSYFGFPQEISVLAEICHHFDVPLIVDEAHGAHFVFHPQLPLSALKQGADLVIQSTHKMLPSMTMSSMLHIQGKRIDPEVVAQYLRMIESSSPSYPLMASLDLARRYMVLEGKEKLAQSIQRINHFREKLTKLSTIQELWTHQNQDLLKLTITPTVDVSGYWIAEELQKKGIYPELADQHRVLFVFSIGTTIAELQTLFSVLQSMDHELCYIRRKTKQMFSSFPVQSKCAFSYQQYHKRDKIRTPIDKAVHKLSADWIVPYPPGIPLLIPGEQWTSKHKLYLERTLQQGGRVRGIDEELHVWVWLEE